MLEPYANIIDGSLDFTGATASHLPDPIGVGAVGGSGTRLLASMLSQSEVAMATPLNQAGDAFEWPPYQKLLSDEMLARHTRQDILNNAYHAFEKLLLKRRRELELQGRAGWKVPGSFHWLEEMSAFFPQMQYILLVRHGLDMAYSGNQNQANNWAYRFDLDIQRGQDGKITPASMLDYWLQANRWALETGKRVLPKRMLVVHFEALCERPQEQVLRILQFLGLNTNQAHVEKMSSLVKRPDSLYRYRSHEWQKDFRQDQLDEVVELGFEL